MKSCAKLIVVLAAALVLAIVLAPARMPAAAAAPGVPEVAPAGKASLSLAAAVSGTLGPEIQLSIQSTAAGEDWFAPAVAYNSLRQSQIMFTHAHSSTGGDIYGYYWSTLPDDWVWFWAMDGVQPAVAYNRANDDFLLVAMVDADQDGRYEIWGEILEGDASGAALPFLIFQWPNRSFWTPRVAWNSYRNEYLVVWNAVDTTTGLANDVAAIRVSASGAVLGNAVIVADTDLPHQADVTYNVAADEYLVVWRQYWGAGDWDIRGARLRGSDAAVVSPPSPFFVSEATEDERSPSVTTNQQGRYLVVWEYAYPGPCCDWDIHGQELDVMGAAVGTRIYISAATDDELNPRVVARPGAQRDYLATWQRETDVGTEVWAWRWGDESTESAYFQVAGAAFWNHTSPAVAINGPGYLFAYEGDAQGDPTVFRHIYGRQWTPHALFLPTIRGVSP